MPGFPTRPGFKVAARIGRPVAEVFEAVADPSKLSGYFTTAGASARLETGTIVHWEFAEFPGAFPVEVVEVAFPSRIVLRWDADDAAAGEPYRTTVTIDFEDLGDGRTLVSISEQGWPATQTGVAASYGNCQGWSQMLCAMKAFVEHGINLREGMYK
jgi:uncharacterized protein YndB with AHSA1/START domain